MTAPYLVTCSRCLELCLDGTIEQGVCTRCHRRQYEQECAWFAWELDKQALRDKHYSPKLHEHVQEAAS